MSPFPTLTARPRRAFVILCILALAALVAAGMLGVQEPRTTQAGPSGKMYWADKGARKIQRANLDGTGVEDLVTTGLSLPTGLALDVGGGKMYWTDRGDFLLRRANLDGTAVEVLITELGDRIGISLDVAAGKMYWADHEAPPRDPAREPQWHRCRGHRDFSPWRGRSPWSHWHRAGREWRETVLDSVAW